MKKISLVACLFIAMFTQVANGDAAVPVSHACIQKVSRHYEVPYWLIVSVMKSEGGWVGLKKKNTNNTYDYGPMQINSIWLSEISSVGVSEKDLQYNGCVNVAVGAWILARHLKEEQFWTAVGAYHSKTPHLNKKYRTRVYETAKQIKENGNIISIITYANKGK